MLTLEKNLKSQTRSNPKSEPATGLKPKPTPPDGSQTQTSNPIRPPFAGRPEPPPPRNPARQRTRRTRTPPRQPADEPPVVARKNRKLYSHFLHNRQPAGGGGVYDCPRLPGRARPLHLAPPLVRAAAVRLARGSTPVERVRGVELIESGLC